MVHREAVSYQQSKIAASNSTIPAKASGPSSQRDSQIPAKASGSSSQLDFASLSPAVASRFVPGSPSPGPPAVCPVALGPLAVCTVAASGGPSSSVPTAGPRSVAVPAVATQPGPGPTVAQTGGRPAGAARRSWPAAGLPVAVFRIRLSSEWSCPTVAPAFGSPGKCGSVSRRS